MILEQLENDHLAVTIHDDASAEILDKATGASWRMGRVALQETGSIDVGHVWLRTGRSICEQYPGRFKGEALGDDAVRYTLLGPDARVMGAFTVRYELDGPWLSCKIADIDESLPSLIFPPPIESESLVLPIGVGKWIHKPQSERKYWTYPAHLTMRWLGGLRGDTGWLAVTDEGWADSGALTAEMSAMPAWLKSLGRWAGARAVRYKFTSGGYVGLARAYRAYAIDKGLHKSLAEKMDEVPVVRNLLGGRLLNFMQAMSIHPESYESRLQPIPESVQTHIREGRSNPHVNVTHAQTAAIVREAQELGMKRGLVNIRGWIAGGYDEWHPDVWPPDPALGTTAELAGLLSTNDPFLSVLHDNYQDIYEASPSWPKGVIRDPDGHPMPGGFWAGGQAYILTARDGLAYAKRNWPDIAGLNPRGMFIDTTTAVQFYESWEPGATQTRSEDAALKRELLQFYKDQGLALGSEEVSDFAVSLVDWLENRHARIAGESIPLWPLVYHDSAFCTRYAGSPMRPESAASPAPRWLADMLWGYFPIWACGSDWEDRKADFAASGFIDDWHARVGADDMVSHRYLTEDGQVEETVFSSGVGIVANFAGEEREVEGVKVKAGGCVIRE
jgi:hypothetical protein